MSVYLLGDRYAMLVAMSDEIRSLIDAAGGLMTKADLAHRWGVSRQRVDELTAMPDFPPPIVTQGRAAWYAWHEVNAWRELERKPGRPPAPPKDA